MSSLIVIYTSTKKQITIYNLWLFWAYVSFEWRFKNKPEFCLYFRVAGTGGIEEPGSDPFGRNQPPEGREAGAAEESGGRGKGH